MSIPQDRPVYRVLAIQGFFGPDDVLYRGPCEEFPDGEVIIFDGEPNEEFEPLNDLAYKKLQTYLEKLDKLGREAAEKAGRAFSGRPRDLDGAIALARRDEQTKVAIMGAPRKTDSIERLVPDETPQTGGGNKKPGKPRTVLKISEAA